MATSCHVKEIEWSDTIKVGFAPIVVRDDERIEFFQECPEKSVSSPNSWSIFIGSRKMETGLLLTDGSSRSQNLQNHEMKDIYIFYVTQVPYYLRNSW